MTDPKKRIRIAAAALLAAALCTGAYGQLSIEPPAPAPGGGGDGSIEPPGAPAPAIPPVAPPAKAATPAPSAENVLEDLLRQRGNGGGELSTPQQKAAATAALAAETGPNGLLRESAIIKDRTGRLRRDASGATVVVFDKNGPALPDMPAVPSRMLELMENAAGFGDPKNMVDLVFPIDAQVLQYNGRNYLLLNQPAAPLPKRSDGMATPPATMPDTVAGVLPQPKIDPVAPGAPAPLRQGEGQLIQQRSGRFVKDTRSGAEIIVFDGDGKHMLDQPMGLIPCKYLGVLEKESENGTKPVKFKVSGLVLEYRGKDYLYPVSVTVIRDLHGGIGG